MLGLETISISPRIEHHTFLWVVFGEELFQFVVEATFVAIAPENNAGVVDVAQHHFLHNLRTRDGLVSPMPARLFALYVETQ